MLIVNYAALDLEARIGFIENFLTDLGDDMSDIGTKKLEGFAPGEHTSINNLIRTCNLSVNKTYPDVAHQMSKCLLEVYDSLDALQLPMKQDSSTWKQLRVEVELLDLTFRTMESETQNLRNELTMQVTLVRFSLWLLALSI